jgi:hypothetical protein
MKSFIRKRKRVSETEREREREVNTKSEAFGFHRRDDDLGVKSSRSESRASCRNNRYAATIATRVHTLAI